MLKTAECVSPKHPDKMCDQISDAILDYALHRDPNARVAVEAMGGHGRVMVMGELTAQGVDLKSPEFDADLRAIVRGIVGESITIDWAIDGQSPEIARGVDQEGAGDQGIMVGYACRDNEAMIPQELFLARMLCNYLFGIFPYDGKTQITLDENGLVHTIVASFQKVKKEKLEEAVMSWVGMNESKVRKGLTLHINPAGDWSIGGFDADTGLTGRKLMVDNYGPQVPVGGGCFSGKDATKVDRSGAYMARHMAVQALKDTPEAREATVKLAYAIGVAEPVMATCTFVFENGDTHEKIYEVVENLKPKAIIETLQLNKPQFLSTAKWGHFGNGFRWD